MLSNRISTRREFFAVFLPAIATAKSKFKPQFPVPKFEIGERVITRRVCDDERSDNYCGIDWDSGVILGYCWQYDEWLSSKYCQGWTYFILFSESNNSDTVSNPYLDFEHESELAKI
jgi:hypothetical protein